MKSSKLFGLITAGALALIPAYSRADNIKIYVSSDNIGGSVMGVKHRSGSNEGYDIYDHKWADAPTNPNSQWIRISTSPFSEPLDGDSRGLESRTAFNPIVDAIGGPFTANNTKFQFSLLSGPDIIPDYNYSITAGSFSETGSFLDRVNNHGGYTGSFTFDSSIGASLILTPSPEPSTAALVATGALAVGLWGIGRYLGRRKEDDRKDLYEILSTAA